MTKIEWCIKHRAFIEMTEPNHILAVAYIKKAEEALEAMRINTIKDWKITTSYYSQYFSLYAILMKIGIKCEIHACTLEFAKTYLKDYLSENDLLFIEKSMKARINSQYYVDKEIPDEDYSMMIKDTPEFMIKCKRVLLSITENKINIIRTKLRKAVLD